MAACTDCGRELEKVKATCPVCKDGPRCFKCWSKHVEQKVCAYGKLEKIEVAI